MGVLVNKPVFIAKNTSVTLSYSLSSVKALVDNEYYEDENNWKSVVLYYKDATGNQKTYVTMNPGTLSGRFRVSARARTNTWQLYKILIQDFDGGSYIVKRADIGSSDDVPVSV
jgi:hypothetical protein